MRKMSKALDLRDRKTIKQCLGEGMSTTEIAVRIGRSKHTVLRELKRGGGAESYSPLSAHSIYCRSIKMRRFPLSFEDRKVIESLLRRNRPAEVVAVRLGRSLQYIRNEIRVGSTEFGYDARYAHAVRESRKPRAEDSFFGPTVFARFWQLIFGKKPTRRRI